VEPRVDFRVCRPDPPPAGVRDLLIFADGRTREIMYLQTSEDADTTATNYLTTSLGVATEDPFDFFLENVSEVLDGLLHGPTGGHPVKLSMRFDAEADFAPVIDDEYDDNALPLELPRPPYDGDVEPLDDEEDDRFVYQDRWTRELWLGLQHYDSEKELLEPYDTALFTATPFIFSNELTKPLWLSLVYRPDAVGQPGNWGTIIELASIAAMKGVPTLNLGYHGGDDIWAQDALVFGQYQLPGETRLAALIPERGTRPLRTVWQDYVRPGVDVYFCQALQSGGDGANSMNWGGNIVVSPPIVDPTDGAGGGDGGPGYAAHPPCPYGKLIVGVARPPRGPSAQTLAFLQAQRTQPVVPIDCGWLSVGHADEVVSFIPVAHPCDETGTGQQGWACMLADADLAGEILGKVRALHDDVGRPNDFVSRAFRDRFEAFGFLDYPTNDLSEAYPVDPVLFDLDDDTHPWSEALSAVHARLQAALDLDRADILRVPVLYDNGMLPVGPALPNMVNALVLGTQIVLPKPWGPRVPVATAKRVLTDLFYEDITDEMVDAAELQERTTESFWVAPDVDSDDVVQQAQTNVRARDQTATVADIGVFQIHVGNKMPKEWKTPPNGWRTVTVTQSTVDIFEAYMIVRLTAVGNTVVFVDDYEHYHRDGGEVHCGTKVRYAPIAVEDGEEWWMA
jgi:hypothetical protein